MPSATSTIANTKLIGSRIQSVERTRSTQKLPMVLALRRAIPRTSAMAMAMPVAAEVKLWTASPTIWLK